jgi:predicted lipoprotein
MTAVSTTCLVCCILSAAAQLDGLRSQVSFASKEKAALRTILEGKVLPLADELAASLARVTAAQQQQQPGSPDGEEHERVSRQIATMQRLLTATVAAMARAGGGGSGGTIPAGR